MSKQAKAKHATGEKMMGTSGGLEESVVSNSMFGGLTLMSPKLLSCRDSEETSSSHPLCSSRHGCGERFFIVSLGLSRIRRWKVSLELVA